MAFQIDIMTPDGPLFSGEASSLMVPGTAGRFQVLDAHAPIVSTLDKGEVKAATTEGEQSFNILSGVIEVTDTGVVSVLIEKLQSENQD